MTLGGEGVQQLAGVLQGRLQLTQGLDLLSGHAQDQGEIIGCVGESHRRLGPFLLQGIPQHEFGF